MDGKARLEAMEKEKEQMIRQYLCLQDRADEVNDEIYRVCCGIEALNARIKQTQERLRKAALKGSPANGTSPHPPANGASKPPSL